jgi:anthranilate phosphoribosyltransferase
MNDFTRHIKKLLEGTDLSEKEMISSMNDLMEGRISEPDMIAFLGALADKGESDIEIASAAKVLRAKAQVISAPPGTIDCCGTGGDGLHTYNISTAVALVSAACGVPVAKHGNRAASSKSGAADVLEALGVTLALPPATLERALNDIGFCFLMAPHHHQAMKHVMPARKAIGRRTIFNLLGPLANPAGTKRQLIGVYARDKLLPVARALASLETDKAWVVHSADGMDEISLSGETYVAAVEKSTVTEHTLTPDNFGLSPIDPQTLTGGDVQHNAAALLALLKGEQSAYRDIVLANAAAVLLIADKVFNLPDGVTLAAAAIDSGKALDVLERYKGYTA